MTKKDINGIVHYYFRINNELIEIEREIYMICIKSSNNFDNQNKREFDKKTRLLQHNKIYGEAQKIIIETLLFNELIKALYNALEQLTLKDRALIEDIYFNDISEYKIAMKTGILRTTISYRKKRILKQLKKYIKEISAG